MSPDLRGSRSGRNSVKLRRSISHIGNSVYQNLCTESLPVISRERYTICLIAIVGRGAKPERLRFHDCSDQVLDIEVVLAKIFGQVIEQWLVGSRIRQSNIVDGINNSATQDLRPDSVCHYVCKVRVLWR